MALFDPTNHTKSEARKRLYAQCEVACTPVEFSAVALFVIGSILFFSEATTYFATWFFAMVSVLFGLRPTIKLYREIRYLRLGDYDDITKS